MINNVTVWLDEIVEKHALKEGYVDVEKSVTYDSLRKESIAIAFKLYEKTLFKAPIAIFTEKSVDMVTAFFGVAYSGNFYTPIDVDMPKPRVVKIFDTLQPKVVISKRKYESVIKEIDKQIPILFLDDICNCYDVNKEKIVLENRKKTCDTDLLYVLFTSGSTGVPKGVTICHQSVVDYVDQIEEAFNINTNSVFGNQAPFYFDNSVLDIYTTLKTGATMYIIPHELFAWPVRLLQYIDEKKIDTIFWVPSMLVLVSRMKALSSVNLDGKLKNVLFAGEVMPTKHFNVWRKYLPNAVYANLYGPTEITVDCTYYIADREFADDEPIPIGKAMINSDVLLFDSNDRLITVPNKIGELCVRGSSLSKGYYNNPEKTAEVFVQNPLNKMYPEIIYRTGDLVKYNDRYEIIYVSRKDHQIKHMGHRIELGEIENAVSSLEEINISCCLYDNEKQRIVLFVEEDVDFVSIKNRLKELIPEYMIPGRLIRVEQMPMNANGKIDKVELSNLLKK